MAQWVIFRDSETGQELCGYTVFGTFEGEAEDTKALLAYERGIPVERIKATLEERPSKKKTS